MAAGKGNQHQHISALDVNPISGIHSTQGAYYADDDSVVSSNVTDDGSGDGSGGDSSGDSSGSGDGGNDDSSGGPEVAMLTHAAETAVENSYQPPPQEDNGKCICMPRSRREWCIVLLALLLVVAVALGTGLGLSLSLRKAPGIDENNKGGENDDETPDGNGTATPTLWPTYAPTDTAPPVDDPGPPDDPDDLASAVQYHTTSQGISGSAAFPEANAGGEATPQQQALDFLAVRDSLPSAVLDDEEEQNDDPLAVPAEPLRRPYLTTTTPAYRVTQRYATVVLYYATDGDDWDTNRLWLEPGVHECDFIGVTCEELPIPDVTLEWAMENEEDFPGYDDASTETTMERMVVAIDLPENNVAGTLPQELMALPYLGRLGLWNNQIGGSLPKQLGKLTLLFSLLLDGNSLVGNIPGQLGQMKELKDLFLDRNEGIAGRIPSGLGNLAKLERLRLSNTSLRGSIPSALSKLTNLVDLSLQNNRLSQRLPEGIDALVNLDSLTLSGNKFTGSIPDSWRNLTRLERLEVHANDLSFEVEDWLCAMRTTGPEGGGRLETLTADCQGNASRVSCNCCTNCPVSSGV